MKVIKLFKDRAICPRYDGNGLIYYKYIEELKYGIYICDECEAMWEQWENIYDYFQNLSTYFDDKGVISTNLKVHKEDYNWVNESIEIENSSYYKCPLFQCVIYEGDCYDINMVLANYVKREILEGFELEIGERINIQKANPICESCKHRL